MENPFVSGPTTEETTELSASLPTFREYAWDFEHDCFIMENGKPVVVTENEALKVWIYKLFKTERWRYRAYDDVYGVELEQFIGKSTNNADSAVEVKRYITEALEVNPHIKSIDDITFTNEADVLAFSISLTTIYGEMEVSF